MSTTAILDRLPLIAFVAAVVVLVSVGFYVYYYRWSLRRKNRIAAADMHNPEPMPVADAKAGAEHAGAFGVAVSGKTPSMPIAAVLDDHPHPPNNRQRPASASAVRSSAALEPSKPRPGSAGAVRPLQPPQNDKEWRASGFKTPHARFKEQVKFEGERGGFSVRREQYEEAVGGGKALRTGKTAKELPSLGDGKKGMRRKKKAKGAASAEMAKGQHEQMKLEFAEQPEYWPAANVRKPHPPYEHAPPHVRQPVHANQSVPPAGATSRCHHSVPPFGATIRCLAMADNG